MQILMVHWNRSTIEIEFDLSKIELGWAVASLTLSATFSMLVAGPLSDKIGTKKVLSLAASVEFKRI